jgi:hypothetical protein
VALFFGRNPYERFLKSASKIGSTTTFVAATTRSRTVGDPQRPLRPVRLRNVPPPHRMRPVHTRAKTSLCLLEKRLNAFLLDHRQSLSVDAGSPLVRLDSLPCLRQNVTPADPVV